MIRMGKVKIKPVRQSDLGELQKIGRQTFYESFAEGNDEENMRSYLDEMFSTDHLKDELNNQGSEFYFAVVDRRTVGYLKLNYGQSQTELKDENSLEIERIYVFKEFQGKGIGQMLYDRALEVARSRDSDYVWLGVWEKNPGAIRFYEKNGFVEFDRHIFKLGEDLQTDIMMRLKLKL